jgi:hypothetical protein
MLGSVPPGIGPAHPRRLSGVGAFAAIVRPVDPHPSPPNAGTQCRSLPLRPTDRRPYRFSARHDELADRLRWLSWWAPGVFNAVMDYMEFADALAADSANEPPAA